MTAECPTSIMVVNPAINPNSSKIMLKNLFIRRTPILIGLKCWWSLRRKFRQDPQRKFPPPVWCWRTWVREGFPFGRLVEISLWFPFVLWCSLAREPPPVKGVGFAIYCVDPFAGHVIWVEYCNPLDFVCPDVFELDAHDFPFVRVVLWYYTVSAIGVNIFTAK